MAQLIEPLSQVPGDSWGAVVFFRSVTVVLAAVFPLLFQGQYQLPSPSLPDQHQQRPISQSSSITNSQPMAHTPPLTPQQLAELVTVEQGTVPLVLSVPHGGRALIPNATERRGRGLPDFQTVRDSWTIELATACIAELQRSNCGKPYLVLARFDRKYLDVNRPPEGAYECAAAQAVYDYYHQSLHVACRQICRRWGGGLLLDLHGQGEYPDAICRGTLNGRSVQLLLDRHGWAALVGKRGLFGYLQRLGYKVLPDCLGHPQAREVPAYQGGYIVAAHGSHNRDGLDAVQVEIGLRLRQDHRWQQTARDLAAALTVWLQEYYPACLSQ